jgi:3-oxoacyl-[acyl-carrier protein] reductase
MTDWERKPGFDLAGKRALVIGFGNPAGLAVALALAEAGADVAVTSATLDGDEIMAAKRAARAIAGLGRQTMSQGWDVTLPGNVQVGIRQVAKEFGKPSIVVYNADAPLLKPLTKLTDAEIGQALQVNLAGALYTARSFARELPEEEAGRFIVITTLLGERGLPGATAYGAARAGVQGLVAGLAQELGPRGVTANAIAAGWMEWTPGRGSDDPAGNLLLRYIPLGRFGTAEDLAPLAVLLASDAAGYLSGQVFHVDGGVGGHL